MLAAVVKQDHRIGIVVPQVPNQVYHTLLTLMLETREDISNRRYLFLRCCFAILSDSNRLATGRSCSRIATWRFTIMLVVIPISIKNSGNRVNRMRMPPTARGLLGTNIALMDHVHRKRMIFQRQHTARVGAPNKPGVHADIVLHEPVAFPVRFPITQLAAQQPHAMLWRVDVLIGAAALQVVVEQSIDSADLDSRIS